MTKKLHDSGSGKSQVQQNPLVGGKEAPLLDQAQRNRLMVLKGMLDKGHFNSVLEEMRRNPDAIQLVALIHADPRTSPKIKERSRIMLERACTSDVDISSAVDLLIKLGFGNQIMGFSIATLNGLVNAAMDPETRDGTLLRLHAGLKSQPHITFASAKVLGTLAENDVDISFALPDLALLLDASNKIIRFKALNAIRAAAEQEWGKEKVIAALNGSIDKDNRSIMEILLVLSKLMDEGLDISVTTDKLAKLLRLDMKSHESLVCQTIYLLNGMIKQGVDVSSMLGDIFDLMAGGLVATDTFRFALLSPKNHGAAIAVILEKTGNLEYVSRTTIIGVLCESVEAGADLSPLFSSLFYWPITEDRPNGEDDRQYTFNMIDSVTNILVYSAGACRPDAEKMRIAITAAMTEFMGSKVFMRELERNSEIYYAYADCFNRVMATVQAGMDGPDSVSGARPTRGPAKRINQRYGR